MLYQGIGDCAPVFFIPFFGLFDTKVRLITVLSITSVTAFMSCIFADDIIADKGIPCLSVKICLFVPTLLLSVGLLPVMSPLLRATLLIYCQWIAIISI